MSPAAIPQQPEDNVAFLNFLHGRFTPLQRAELLRQPLSCFLADLITANQLDFSLPISAADLAYPITFNPAFRHDPFSTETLKLLHLLPTTPYEYVTREFIATVSGESTTQVNQAMGPYVNRGILAPTAPYYRYNFELGAGPNTTQNLETAKSVIQDEKSLFSRVPSLNNRETAAQTHKTAVILSRITEVFLSGQPLNMSEVARGLGQTRQSISGNTVLRPWLTIIQSYGKNLAIRPSDDALAELWRAWGIDASVEAKMWNTAHVPKTREELRSIQRAFQRDDPRALNHTLPEGFWVPPEQENPPDLFAARWLGIMGLYATEISTILGIDPATARSHLAGATEKTLRYAQRDLTPGGSWDVNINQIISEIHSPIRVPKMRDISKELRNAEKKGERRLAYALRLWQTGKVNQTQAAQIAEKSVHGFMRDTIKVRRKKFLKPK